MCQSAHYSSSAAGTMQQTIFVVLLCTALFANQALGQFGEFDIPEEFNIGESRKSEATERPDEHQQQTEKLAETPTSFEKEPAVDDFDRKLSTPGRPEDHFETEKLVTEKPKEDLIGRPDGHDNRELIGRPDGHDNRELIGKPDGHDNRELIGKPDGHDNRELIGRPDGHDWSLEDVPSEVGVDDYSEPLVRCKRPLCTMDCVFGFQTDASGCPICKCLEDPCQGVQCVDGNICHPVECESDRSCVKLSAQCMPPSRNCPEPMCANFCPNGYAYSLEGCMTCDCESEQSEDEPSKVQETEMPCPAVLCVDLCPGERKKNEHGCETCDCVDVRMDESSCEGVVCEVGQICRVSDSGPSCVPKPLCHLAQEMAAMKRNVAVANRSWIFAPECETDGAFKPRQCHVVTSDCWCVDDRGKEIDGTRVTSGEAELFCEPHKTEVVHVDVLFSSNEEFNYDNDGDGVDSIDHDGIERDGNFAVSLSQSKDIFGNAFSSWLLIDRQFISITKVEQSSRMSISVQLEVRDTDAVDLPSAVEHMKRKMRMGDCRVTLPNGLDQDEVHFTPDTDTLNVQHQYGHEQFRPISSVGPPWYIRCFGDYHFILVVMMILLLVMILTLSAVLMVHRHRRLRQSLQFRHRRLSDQLIQDQRNIVKGEIAADALSESAVILVAADELEKKHPVA